MCLFRHKPLVCLWFGKERYRWFPAWNKSYLDILITEIMFLTEKVTLAKGRDYCKLSIVNWLAQAFCCSPQDDQERSLFSPERTGKGEMH